eukprot:1145020-Pelagomonas_calceolata.AAC.1
MHHNFCNHLHENGVDQAYNTLNSWMTQTACYPLDMAYVGMTKPLKSSMSSTHNFPSRKPSCFDTVSPEKCFYYCCQNRGGFGMLADNYTECIKHMSNGPNAD